jgi:hypothetical protein
MSYSQFKTLASVKEAFGIKTRAGVRFLPELPPLGVGAMCGGNGGGAAV